MKWDQAKKHMPKPEPVGKADEECRKSPSGEHAWYDVVHIDGPPLENPPKQVCAFCMATR